MPLIGSLRDQDGGVRIFFDMRPKEVDPAEVARITRLIERAFNARSADEGVEMPADPT
jgi:hypothetical protein